MNITYSPLDIILPRLLKEIFPTICPLILAIINSSLTNGVVPSSFKHAIGQPLLKKPDLDLTDHKNYRPISKLPFISKILEKAVFYQISPYLNTTNTFDKFQSGFRALHSTDSALLKVHNNILLSLDSGSCAILVLLNLSTAFDTIDRDILLKRLEGEVGLQGLVLKWFTSYLTERTFSVKLGNCSSSPAPIKCAIPQGSILGPLLFSLFMHHCYADDTQFYLPVSPDTVCSLNNLFNCLNDIKCWLARNFN